MVVFAAGVAAGITFELAGRETGRGSALQEAADAPHLHGASGGTRHVLVVTSVKLAGEEMRMELAAAGGAGVELDVLVPILASPSHYEHQQCQTGPVCRLLRQGRAGGCERRKAHSRVVPSRRAADRDSGARIWAKASAGARRRFLAGPRECRPNPALLLASGRRAGAAGESPAFTATRAVRQGTRVAIVSGVRPLGAPARRRGGSNGGM